MKKAKGIRGKADQVFSLWVRSIGYCERCGKTDHLQCAHIISRRYNRFRCDPDNAICLCFGCHKFFTHNPLDFYEWIEENFPDLFRIWQIHRVQLNEPWKTPPDHWADAIKQIRALPTRRAT